MDRIAAAHARYAEERDALIARDHQVPGPPVGSGAPGEGVKCLHAHLAWWLTGADDPVGEWTAQPDRPAPVLTVAGRGAPWVVDGRVPW